MAFFVNAWHKARIIPWTITNNKGVDAKRGFLI